MSVLGRFQNFRNMRYARKVKENLGLNATFFDPISLSNTFSLENLSGDINNAKIGEGCVLQCQITVFEKGSFEFGKYNYVGNSKFICSNSIRIGSGCFFSDRILVFDGSHHPLSAVQRLLDAYHFGIEGKRPDAYSDSCTQSFVEIGDAVWVGANAVITSGVKIGDGSIIGAGSVVTKDVPAWSVAVGNPAKVVRSLPVEEINDTLERLCKQKKTK